MASPRGAGKPAKARAASNVPAGADAVIVPIAVGGSSPRVDAAFLARRGFEGRVGETQAMAGEGGNVVVAVGVGDPVAVDPDVLRRAAASGIRAAGRAARVATTLLDALPVGADVVAAAQAVVEGALLASYSFTAFKSAPRPGTLVEFVVVSDRKGVSAGVSRGVIVAGAVALVRDLVNEPSGSLTPKRLADVARKEATKAGLGYKVLDERDAKAAGLGGLIGVAAGSDQPPRLIELLYEPKGATASTPTVAFVGKGITFDSGGLSLKTAAGMMTMKTDMSGAAAVIGSMTAIAALGAPVRVIGLCPITENMPNGAATKPGDVLEIRNGKTVEVLNTDAEGRLVLADALALAAEAKVDAVVDLATLTGAVSTALGRNIAAIMGTDASWTAAVSAAAARAGESVWPLPLAEEYRRDIDSDVADLRNVAASNPAGVIIAGLFLREFTGGLPWVHLDIAGTARSDSDDGSNVKGATGWGVRTLIELATAGEVTRRDGAERRARWAGRTPVARLAGKSKGS